MTLAEIEVFLTRLKSRTPPNDLDTLRLASSLPWSTSDDREIRIYTEILLRLTAEAIMVKFSEDHQLKVESKNVFLGIVENVAGRNLMTYTDFNEYFLKFRDVVLEI